MKILATAVLTVVCGATIALAQTERPTPPPDYIIGPDDVLSIVFWRDKEMSSEVVVRPDGKISLPILNDIQAEGLTPDELRVRIVTEATRYLEDPNATVVVKEIKSRKVYITGEVEKPGPFMLTTPTTVMQLIAMAGGLREYAGDQIVIMRTVNGTPIAFRFNYQHVLDGKNMRQNIELKPGDTVVVR